MGCTWLDDKAWELRIRSSGSGAQDQELRIRNSGSGPKKKEPEAKDKELQKSKA